MNSFFANFKIISTISIFSFLEIHKDIFFITSLKSQSTVRILLRAMVTCSYFLVICSLLYLSNAASELPISNTAPDIEADRIELVGLKSSFIPGKAGGTLEMVINEYQGEEVIRQSYCYTSDEHNPYTVCFLERDSKNISS